MNYEEFYDKLENCEDRIDLMDVERAVTLAIRDYKSELWDSLMTALFWSDDADANVIRVSAIKRLMFGEE